MGLNQEPVISVIVPVYNVEKYLKKCIDSIRNQTLQDLEIILVDDGSTDKSGDICDDLKTLDGRIKVIHQENRGLGLARNSGLKLSRGKYVGFVDSDDYIAPDMYERLYKAAVENQADISYCAWKKFYQDEKKADISDSDQKLELKVWSGKASIRQYLLDRIGLPPEKLKDNLYGASVWNGIFRKQVIDKHGICFLSERQFIAEDMIFDIDVIPCCNTIVHCNAQLYYYRYNPLSLTTSYKPERFEKNVELYDEMKRRLELIYDEREIFNSLSRYFLSFTRNAIIQEVFFIDQTGYKAAKRNIQRICKNSRLQSILNSYEYRKLPAKYKIYCFLEKKCWAAILIFLTRSFYLFKRKS